MSVSLYYLYLPWIKWLNWCLILLTDMFVFQSKELYCFIMGKHLLWTLVCNVYWSHVTPPSWYHWCPLCAQVTPREKFVCVDCPKGDSLWSKTAHYMARDECVHNFVLEFGWNPLQTVHFRADPVLLYSAKSRTDMLSHTWFEFIESFVHLDRWTHHWTAGI